MSDIVKRLQEPAYWISSSNEGHEGESDVPREAADTITRLTAEVEQNAIDLEEYRRDVERLRSVTVVQESLIRKSEAKNEKLRAALDILHAAMTAKKPIPMAFKKAIIEARAELSGDKE